MDLEKLKKARNTLENYRKCELVECDGKCVDCPCYYDPGDINDSVDVAITVINDVIKNMERLKNGQICKDNYCTASDIILNAEHDCDGGCDYGWSIPEEEEDE